MRPSSEREDEDEARDDARLNRAFGELDQVDGEADLSRLLLNELTPFSDAELVAARQPHRHAFGDGESGLFPVGEVTVIASPGRAGKTMATLAVAVRLALQLPVGFLPATVVPQVVIYSAEDDRDSYARKLLAHMLKSEHPALIRSRVVVPNLNAPGVCEARQIVTSFQREPKASAMASAVTDALLDMTDPPGLVIFETASTLSDADEDNRGHRVLIAALKQIARDTNTAVVLVHHTSQAANAKLPYLAISVDDIRGATALVANARQCHILLDLGSTENPFPDADMRTTFHGMLTYDATHRISVLVCLNSSKSKDPPPIYFRWEFGEAGPRCVEFEPSVELAGKPWRNVLKQITAVHAKRKVEAAQKRGLAAASLVMAAVAQLEADGQQPTVNQVTKKVPYSAAVVKDALAAAVEEGDLITAEEKVPRTKGTTMVYRLASREGAEAKVDSDDQLSADAAANVGDATVVLRGGFKFSPDGPRLS